VGSTSTDALTLERAPGAPLYAQLKSAILDAIESGRWSAGDRLPSEAELCDALGVSRTTVRQALAELEADGLLRREQGRGTFVAEPAAGSGFLQSAVGFQEEAARAGHVVTSRVLKRTVEPLPAGAADALGLAPGTHGVVLERVRSVDGEVVMYVQNHLLLELAEGVLEADLTQASLYATLREAHGVRVAGGRRTVEAVLADERRAELLEVRPGAPLLQVQSVSWDADGRPFECYVAWHRSDRARLEIQVVPGDE
jgi:GntR family transcriptional regulator